MVSGFLPGRRIVGGGVFGTPIYSYRPGLRFRDVLRVKMILSMIVGPLTGKIKK